MRDDAYHFVTRWRVEATCGEVADVIGDPLALPRWWPSVYLKAESLPAVDAVDVADARDAAGDDVRPTPHQRVRLLTKGWLPYHLRWVLEVVESRYPYGSTVRAVGDLEGLGIWTFAQDGPFVDVTYDWRVRAEKPLVRLLAPLCRPLLESNHRWAMAQGETSLNIELARRRATSEDARARVPPPPGPVSYAAVALVAGGVAMTAGLVYLLARGRGRRSPRRTGR